MRPRGSPEALEARRRRAMVLLEHGLSLDAVGRRIGCHASSVMRWRNAMKRGGDKALKPKRASGRPPKLNARRKERLVRYLLQGAPVHGYRTDLWTTQRIADLIAKKLGVRYHRDHIGRLMRDLGWSHQKPEHRAMERDDEAIERWKQEEWPRIKKGPRGWAPTSCLSTNPDSC